MPEYLILFCYYRPHCPVTAEHFRRLRQLHSRVPIVPLSDGQATDLPHTVNVSRYPSRWDTSDPWASPDTLIYRWFENRRVEARRYIVFEWDILCEVHLPDLLRPVWNADLACHTYVTWEQSNQEWVWFQQRHLLPKDLRPHAAGVAPFGFLLLSHHALDRITPVARPSRLFCELRLGTLARSLGLRIEEMPWIRETVSCSAHFIKKVDHPTIYHPVKELGRIGD
jgi:hypothetical protein